jgi:uncharacterized protein (DUF305 family)
MKHIIKGAVALSVIMGSTFAVVAQQNGTTHQHMQMPQTNAMEQMGPKGDTGPSSQAYSGAMNKMHQDMNIEYSGNADVDFVRSMVPHHQGAIDMAKIVLAFGKDPAIRKLAEDVIKAQENEVAFMKDWLSKNAK